MNQLPEGWSKASLSDLVTRSLGGDWGKDTREDDCYIRVKVIRGTDFKSWRRVKGCEAAERWVKDSSLQKRRLLSGNIVVEVSGGGPSQPVGRAVLIDESVLQQTDLAMICSNFFRQIRLSEIVDPAFVNFFLSYAYSEGAFDQYQTQTTNLRNLNFSHFLEADIRVAPLVEQRRIVAKLEELFAIVEACQKRLAKIPVTLKRFRQSVLAAACSGRLTPDWREKNEDPHWEEKILGDLIIEKPKNGYSAKPVKYRTPFRVLTLTATTSGEFKPEHFKYFEGPIGADSGLWLQPNDILVQRGNTIEYVGVPAIYDGHSNEFIYPDLMMRLRARPEVDSKFLYFALSWERSRTYLRKKATGTAGSMPKINQQTLISVPIDLPPLAEQQEIVRRVEGLFRFADQIKGGYVKAQTQVDKLTQSILAKAFRGELVPTEAELARREGRDYEPASILLDRIRTARSDAEATSNATRKDHLGARRLKREPVRRKMN